jgi:hypothetical protein
MLNDFGIVTGFDGEGNVPDWMFFTENALSTAS